MTELEVFQLNKKVGLNHSEKSPCSQYNAIWLICDRRNLNPYNVLRVTTEDELRDQKKVKWNREVLPALRKQGKKLKPKRTLLYGSDSIKRVDKKGNKHPFMSDAQTEYFEVTILKTFDDLGITPIYKGNTKVCEGGGWYSIQGLYLVDNDIYFV